MTEPKDLGRDLVVIRHLRDHLTVLDKGTREALAEALDVSDRLTIRLPDGTPIGTAAWTKGSEKVTVVDPAALLEWVRANHPDEIVTTETVRPSYLTHLQTVATRTSGEVYDHVTGEAIPGIKVLLGDGHVTVNPAADAAAAISRAWAAGQLPLLGGLLQLPPPTEPDTEAEAEPITRDPASSVATGAGEWGGSHSPAPTKAGVANPPVNPIGAAIGDAPNGATTPPVAPDPAPARPPAGGGVPNPNTEGTP